MEMPTPSDGHRRLEKIAGQWEGEEKMYPSPWDPQGGTAIGRINSRMALNGFALINDYEQERNGKIAFNGHGVFTYDPKTESYTLVWVDCMGAPPEIFKGNFDGAVLKLAHGGPGMHVRLTYDMSEPDVMSTSMEMSQDGSAWNRFFDARLKRRRFDPD
ncbi:MAG TPA: DUF1579 family protein [Chthoniobacterales bacterium]|jgi:hypothetical protein|nr:DUF1579 family protein [Chthoniobacterales bacterium]